MEVINIAGKRFGKLMVLKRLNERGATRQIKWECICDCGKSHVTTGESIRSGKSKSCGCNRLTPPNKVKDRTLAVWKQLYQSTIIKRSKKWGILSDISLEEFIRMSQGLCFYCGTESSNFATDRNSCGNKTSDTIVRYNGIDRIDSKGGYTKGNMVACCKYCNTAKNIMSQSEFMAFIERVYEHNHAAADRES
jgi:hypothetical protein